MAGAIPVGDVRDHQVYGSGLSAAKYIANLFSPNDKVLRALFPLGEIGGSRTGLEPIGLNGEPVTFGWTQREQMIGFGHGDYWKRISVVKFLAWILGIPVPNTLPSHEPQSLYLPRIELG